MIRRTYALVALTSLLTCAALAQTGNPADMAPDTPQIDSGHPPATHANTADQVFTREIALGGVAELNLAKLATQKSNNNDVRDFAHHMMDDHQKANDRLVPIAKANNVPLRKNLDMDHSVMQAQLEKLSGAGFDTTYINGQIREHQKTALLLEWEIGSGQDARVREYAMQILPTVLNHLERAKKLQVQLAHTADRM